MGTVAVALNGSGLVRAEARHRGSWKSQAGFAGFLCLGIHKIDRERTNRSDRDCPEL